MWVCFHQPLHVHRHTQLVCVCRVSHFQLQSDLKVSQGPVVRYSEQLCQGLVDINGGSTLVSAGMNFLGHIPDHHVVLVDQFTDLWENNNISFGTFDSSSLLHQLFETYWKADDCAVVGPWGVCGAEVLEEIRNRQEKFWNIVVLRSYFLVLQPHRIQLHDRLVMRNVAQIARRLQ